jgi:dihydroflavonol-4-reductase
VSSCARRVLLTGASGLIGTHVLQALLEGGYAPRTLSRGPLQPWPDATANPAAGQVEHLRGDIRDGDLLERAMRGCEAVIHTAALYSYSRARAPEMQATNVQGTRCVLDAAAAAGVERVVVTSSCATCGPVRGRPADERDTMPEWERGVAYKDTKLAAERLALARARAGQDVVVVNPTTTVGPGDRRPTPSGRMVRDVIEGRIRGYISSGGLNLVGAADVARGHLLALEHGRSGERYLLGGENLAMGELFRMIAALAGVSRPWLAVPYPLAYLAARIGDPLARALGREPQLLVLDEVRLARLPMYFTSAKAARELGYRHAAPEQVLAETVAWFARLQERARPAAARRWTYSSVRSGGASAGAGGGGSS